MPVHALAKGANLPINVYLRPSLGSKLPALGTSPAPRLPGVCGSVRDFP